MARKNEPPESMPISLADVAERIRWAMDVRLEFIEAVASGPQTFAPDAACLEEALERWCKDRVREGREEVDALLLTRTQAEVLQWWRDFPQRELLTMLVRRAERRKAKWGPPDGRRPPSHEEGLRIARPMLADVAKKSQFNFQQEAEAVSTTLAVLHLPPFMECSFMELREFVELSAGNCAYFDALAISYGELRSRRMPIPGEISWWHQQVASGKRQRPHGMRRTRKRPLIAVHPVRNVQIHFVMDLLRRLGIRPRGRDRSGCRIVTEVLGLSEGAVELIWKERVWTRSFVVALQEHSRAIAERHGPFHTTQATGS